MIRAIKLMQVRGSAFARVAAATRCPSSSARWLRAFAPSYAPPGIAAAGHRRGDAAAAERASRKSSRTWASLRSRSPAPSVAQLGLLGGSVLAWANHTALLAVGDLGAALDGSRAAQGLRGGDPVAAPTSAPTWIAKTPEAKDLVAFGVSDGYTEARSRLGLR